MKHYLLILALICGQGALIADAPDLDGMTTEAYLNMLDADSLVEEERLDEARELYVRALRTYRTLRRDHPDFRSDLVEYRIDLLQSRLEGWEGEVPEEDVETVDIRAELPADDFEELYLQTREKMLRDAERLLELERRNIEMVVRMRELQQQVEQEEQAKRELRRQAEERGREHENTTAALQREVRDLSRFNNLLQTRADTLEETNAEIAADLNQSQMLLGELREALEESEEGYQELRREFTEFQADATRTEQRLILQRNQFRDDLALAEDQLQQAGEFVTEAEERVANVELLEETVLELNRRNEAREKEISQGEEERERLLAEIEALNGELEQEREKSVELQSKKEEAISAMEQHSEDMSRIRNLNRRVRQAESDLAQKEQELSAKSAEADRLRLSLEQEKSARLQLQAVSARHLKLLSERMNEVTSLRRELKRLTEDD